MIDKELITNLKNEIYELKQENEELRKYKNAWDEFKNDNEELIDYNHRATKNCILYKNMKMYLLKQKYELGDK